MLHDQACTKGLEQAEWSTYSQNTSSSYSIVTALYTAIIVNSPNSYSPCNCELYIAVSMPAAKINDRLSYSAHYYRRLVATALRA